MRVILALLACFAGMAVGQASQQNSPAFELALVDMKGQKKVLGILPDSVFAPRVSPDGKDVAFELYDPAGPPGIGRRLYVAGLDHLDQRRALPMTPNAVENWAPVWTPDGQRLVFDASGNQGDALYWRRADGSGEAEHLLDARAAEGMYNGGKVLAVITLTGNRDYGISLFDMTTKAVTRLVDYPGSEQHSSRISPDGR